ncbi:MAG: hypothetical protein ACHQM6_10735, partial [Candidatus Kapaibacterium sp.]
MKTKRLAAILLFSLSLVMFHSEVRAQGDILQPGDNESLPTILSIKVSGGYGFGRATQNLGTNGTSAIWWSAGQGEKMDAAIDIPLLPIEVINSDADENEPEKFSIVGLEMEFASGYHISEGGATTTGNQTTTRKYTYIPITIGFNARATLGAGMPSVYVGAGGGIYLKGIYEDNIGTANSATTTKLAYDPPVPFALYGLMGIEIPLLYSPDDGNSMLDLFVQAKLSEVTNYIYKYTS